MFTRIFIFIVPFVFLACSSAERRPNCVPSSDSELKCEEQKNHRERTFHGGFRERP